MALARITNWNPGDVLTAAALNGEFNNVLSNPVALISPTTGAINFNLLAHTGLRLENLAVDPASTAVGRIFFNTARNQAEVDDGTIIRAMPTLSATAISSGDLILGSSASQFTRLGIGSTGQVLVVTSSNTQPSWGVIGPAGLTTGAVASGSILYYSTAATPALTTLPIGTSGQALQVSTGLIPIWVASAGSASGVVKVFTTQIGGLAGITSTVFTIVSTTLTIAPNSTAARLLITAVGTITVASATSGPGGIGAVTLFLDGTNVSTATLPAALSQFGIINSAGPDFFPLGIAWVSSVISTAAHTITLQAAVTSSGTSNSISVLPMGRLAAVELLSTV